MRGVQSVALLLVIPCVAAGQQADSGFHCESHTAAIDRLPGAKFTAAEVPDTAGTREILQADFSSFDPQYSLQSVHFVILFVPAPPNPNTTSTRGRLRLLARAGTHGSEQWRELTDEEGAKDLSQHGSWYDNWVVSDLLRANFEAPQAGEETNPSDDPTVWTSGRPQVRIHQAQKGKPVFLLTSIGLAQAGGHGEVETEQAIVLDLRGGVLTAPAFVGCIKNDFASEQHRDEWVDCRWNSRLQDYVCKSNAYYDHDWRFLLIKGEKLPAKSKARR